MPDFSMSLSGLSSKALEFLNSKNIDADSKGLMSKSERDMLASYLNGSEKFPDEYINIQDELTEFARNFDEQAAKSDLSKDEVVSVRANMSEKDRKKIDTIRDYSTMKAVADGTIVGYTPAQRAYAKALLENSAYARELMLKEQNAVLQTKNQELLEENQELKAQIAASRSSAKEDIDKARVAKAELYELLEGNPDIGENLKGVIENIEKSSENIIDACDKIEVFSNKNISEETFNKAVDVAKAKMDEAKADVQISKQKGRDILANIIESAGENTGKANKEDSKTSKSAPKAAMLAGKAAGKISSAAQNVNPAGNDDSNISSAGQNVNPVGDAINKISNAVQDVKPVGNAVNKILTGSKALKTLFN